MTEGLSTLMTKTVSSDDCSASDEEKKSCEQREKPD